MADVLENYEQDIAWLKVKKVHVSESEADFFADKVALFMLDGQREQEAREEALMLLSDLNLGW